MRKFTNEIKIGMFMVLALGAGAIFWMKTQNLDLKSETYTLKTYFNFAGGIKENSIVALSGIEVGKVDAVNFIYEPATKVEIVMSISNKAKVRTDSIAYIGSAGFIGDAFVGLTAGSADAAFIEPGTEVKSEDPIEMRVLMKKADSIATQIDQAMVDVRKLAASLNGVVGENKERIGSIMKNLVSTSENFNEFSNDIKQHPWKLLMKGK